MHDATNTITLTVDPAFRDLIPPLSDLERLQLEQNILRDGCLDPLIVWEHDGQKLLIDGHHRFDICRENDIAFDVTAIPFADRDAATEWILKHQLGRRNLSPDAASLARGRIYNLRKKAVGRPEKELAQSEPISTAEQLAHEHGVSAATIKRDGEFAEAVETLKDHVPDISEKVYAGDIPSREAVKAAARESEPEIIKERIEGRGARGEMKEVQQPREWSVDVDLDFMARVLERFDKERHRREGNWVTDRDQRRVAEFFRHWAKKFEQFALEV